MGAYLYTERQCWQLTVGSKETCCKQVRLFLSCNFEGNLLILMLRYRLCTECSWNMWHHFRCIFSAQRQWRVCVIVGPWMLLLWVMTFVIEEGEGYHMMCKEGHSPVYLYISDFSVPDYFFLTTAIEKGAQILSTCLHTFECTSH